MIIVSSISEKLDIETLNLPNYKTKKTILFYQKGLF